MQIRKAKFLDIIFYLRRKWLPILYFVLIILVTPRNFSWEKEVFFLLYAFFIFWVIYNIFETKKNAKEPQSDGTQKCSRFFVYLLIFSFLFLFITRLIPFLRFGEAPLGYDTGFYVWRFMATEAPTSPFYLSLVPIHLLGLPSVYTLHFMYVLSQLLIAGGLYILFRSVKRSSSFAFAAVAVFLFVISITQFYAYWWMFAQQMLATSFLFITLALFFRRPVLAILTGGLGVLIHPPTFIVLVFSFFIFFLIHLSLAFFKRRVLNRELLFIFCFGLGISIIVISMRAEAFWGYFSVYILEHHGLVTNFPFWEIPKMKGLFIEPSDFHQLSFFIIPFTIFGFLYPRIWGRYFGVREFSSDLLIFFYTMSLGLLILISFPFIYQHRFLIIFDFFLIIFATPSILILVNYFLRDRSGQILLGIFLVIFFVRIGIAVWTQGPQLFPDELKEIKALSSMKASSQYVIATNSLYTPWLFGFSGQQVIGPGWQGDRWDLSMWIEFWMGEDNERRHQLLSMYSSSPYLYVGRRQPINQPYYEFIQNDPHFAQISPHIWKYNPKL